MLCVCVCVCMQAPVEFKGEPVPSGIDDDVDVVVEQAEAVQLVGRLLDVGQRDRHGAGPGDRGGPPQTVAPPPCHRRFLRRGMGKEGLIRTGFP